MSVFWSNTHDANWSPVFPLWGGSKLEIPKNVFASYFCQMLQPFWFRDSWRSSCLLQCFWPTSMQGMVHGLPITWRKEALPWELMHNGLHFDTGSEDWRQYCTGWNHWGREERTRKESRCSSATSRKFWGQVLSKRTNDHFENEVYLSRPMTLDTCK